MWIIMEISVRRNARAGMTLLVITPASPMGPVNVSQDGPVVLIANNVSSIALYNCTIKSDWPVAGDTPISSQIPTKYLQFILLPRL